MLIPILAITPPASAPRIISAIAGIAKINIIPPALNWAVIFSPHVFLNKSFDLDIDAKGDSFSSTINGITKKVNRFQAIPNKDLAISTPIWVPLPPLLPKFCKILTKYTTIKKTKLKVKKVTLNILEPSYNSGAKREGSKNKKKNSAPRPRVIIKDNIGKRTISLSCFITCKLCFVICHPVDILPIDYFGIRYL